MTVSAILVYGAAGFVGTALSSRLTTELADQAILVDRRPVSETTCETLERNGIGVTVRQAATLSDLDLPRDISTAMIFAGKTDVDEGLTKPSHSFDQNNRIAIEAGEWLRMHPRSRLFYLSSDEVLGESLVPLPENAEHRPTQPYAASKTTAETILHCYRDAYSLNVVTIRACNLVGEHQRAHKLIPIAVTHLAQGEQIPVHGSGRQAREWLAVEDLCDALTALFSSNASAGIYHCSSGVSLTVLEVIEIIARALGMRLRFRHVADRLVQDRGYSMSCSRLRSVGWSPRHEVREAIGLAARTMCRALSAGEYLLSPDAPAQRD